MRKFSLSFIQARKTSTSNHYVKVMPFRKKKKSLNVMVLSSLHAQKMYFDQEKNWDVSYKSKRIVGKLLNISSGGKPHHYLLILLLFFFLCCSLYLLLSVVFFPEQMFGMVMKVIWFEFLSHWGVAGGQLSFVSSCCTLQATVYHYDP